MHLHTPRYREPTGTDPPWEMDGRERRWASEIGDAPAKSPSAKVTLSKEVDPDFAQSLYEETKPATSTWLRTAEGGFTIIHKGEPVGIIGLKPVEKKGPIGGFVEVALVPEARGKGIGLASVLALIEKHPKVSTFGWTARKDNTGSLQLLQRLDGGVFPRTVNDSRRVQVEGIFHRKGKAHPAMREALANSLAEKHKSMPDNIPKKELVKPSKTGAARVATKWMEQHLPE